jgi:hypothetical protein
MKFETVGEIWRSFWSAIRPEGPVSPVQIQETRRAFYGGFAACLLLLRNTVGQDEMTEDEGVAYAEALLSECSTFQRLVKEGKA